MKADTHCTKHVITDEASRPVGILTDRDLVLGILARSIDPGTITVGDIMRSAFIIENDIDVFTALNMMKLTGEHYAVVTNYTRGLVGILSVTDILRFISNSLDELVSDYYRGIDHGKAGV